MPQQGHTAALCYEASLQVTSPGRSHQSQVLQQHHTHADTCRQVGMLRSTSPCTQQHRTPHSFHSTYWCLGPHVVKAAMHATACECSKHILPQCPSPLMDGRHAPFRYNHAAIPDISASLLHASTPRHLQDTKHSSPSTYLPMPDICMMQ